jgi:hypothetical protein
VKVRDSTRNGRDFAHFAVAVLNPFKQRSFRQALYFLLRAAAATFTFTFRLFRLSCTPAGDVIQSFHEESHCTIARATVGGH